MPSGARKRKAAKKKQEKVTPLSANTTSTTSSTQGDEDLKNREIEGGHNTEGVEGVEKPTEDVKNGGLGVEKERGHNGDGVLVEGKSKEGDGFDEKKGDSSSSGSSSDSDDGSREVEKNIMIVENAPVIDLVEADVTIADGPIEVTHTTPVTKLDDLVTECVSEAGEGNIALLNEKVTVDCGPSADSSLKESGRLREIAKEPTPEDKDEVTFTQLEISKELEPDNGKYENIVGAATSDATESAVNKNEEKLMLSYNPPRVDTTEDAEHSQALVWPQLFDQINRLLGRVAVDFLRHLQALVDNCRI